MRRSARIAMSFASMCLTACGLSSTVQPEDLDALRNADTGAKVHKICAQPIKDEIGGRWLKNFTEFELALVGVLTGAGATYLVATGAAAHAAPIAGISLVGSVASGATPLVHNLKENPAGDKYGKAVASFVKGDKSALADMKEACANMLFLP